jgi:hypothetical protein
MKAAAKTKTSKPVQRATAPAKGKTVAFAEIVGLIQSARTRAFQTVNTELISLYRRIGKYINAKFAINAK